MLRAPLAFILGIDPPPKRNVFDQLCGGSEGSGKFSRQSSRSLFPTFDSEASLSSLLPPLDQPSKGYLPGNVLQQIIEHVGHDDLKALHRVSRAWREAVCYGLRTIAPTTCNVAMLRRFPGIETLGMEHITFKAPHLSALTRIRTLVVHDCCFQHPISDLSALTSLERLKLKDVGANMRGVDTLMSGLTTLTSLEIIRNERLNTLPSMVHLSALTELKELVVKDSHNRDKLPYLTHIASLSSLQRLTLVKVRVDNHVVNAMSGLTDLDTLEIPDCYRVTDPALPALSALTGLTKLDLRTLSHRRDNPLTVAGISHLSTLTNLQILSLSGHQGLTAGSLSFLSTFTRLTDLGLRDLILLEEVPFLAPLERLVHLNLAGNYRSFPADEHLTTLRLLTAMKTLDLSDSACRDAAAAEIANMKQLEYLSVAYTNVTNEGLLRIVEGCPALKYANVDGCSISTLCMLKIVRKYRKLSLWTKGPSTSLPNWMYRVDAVLISQPLPYCRKLRVLHQGEGSWAVTTGVFLGVVAFFIAYFTALFAVFAAVFLLPLAALGVLCLLVGILAISVRLLTTIANCVCALALRSGRYWPGNQANMTPAPDLVAEMV